MVDRQTGSGPGVPVNSSFRKLRSYRRLWFEAFQNSVFRPRRICPQNTETVCPHWETDSIRKSSKPRRMYPVGCIVQIGYSHWEKDKVNNRHRWEDQHRGAMMPSDHYFEELYGVTEERALNFWATNLREAIGTEQWPGSPTQQASTLQACSVIFACSR